MTTGMLTLDVIPRLDVSIMNGFEKALSSLKLMSKYLVDHVTWTSLVPRLRLFVKLGRTDFDLVDGATITTKDLDDFGLRDEFTITTLGQLLRWTLIEGLLTTFGCWDAGTTSYVLGVPSLPHDKSLSIVKVGRLSMSLHYSYLRTFALYKGIYVATLSDYYHGAGSTYMLHKLHSNVGKAMDDIFSKYEVAIQHFDVSTLTDELTLEALRVAEQRHYFYKGEWTSDDSGTNVDVVVEERVSDD
ncbi:hypothetical protein Pmar_PMAR021169 [Perkinsus marinus ATCC 50983]|uniref:Uncharacterized protein n=1 Tax=Perkinsus marinus (strain ATCC 50983 / TXsc) TaxID=423536 RepID=C5KM55_PERM5|nr:hypothetical protein Pmar_PMAR021169 [Perkinsus marinus ATCC 50983]EER14416.1 hypothetical protein Pmar_PMAR021169 [Perkinsus marinus ATCC 50983]|eukprot:XP_002782621.1 hypothetical protein Pmar_PMAR021169 [Perkinsus marinus ATCC 50983]